MEAYTILPLINVPGNQLTAYYSKLKLVSLFMLLPSTPLLLVYMYIFTMVRG